MREHIHTPNDDRGPRNVFVNGNKLEHCTWADTKSGVVWFVPQPMRLHKRLRDEIYHRKLRGKVEVVSCES